MLDEISAAMDAVQCELDIEDRVRLRSEPNDPDSTPIAYQHCKQWEQDERWRTVYAERYERLHDRPAPGYTLRQWRDGKDLEDLVDELGLAFDRLATEEAQ